MLLASVDCYDKPKFKGGGIKHSYSILNAFYERSYGKHKLKLISHTL